MTDNQTSPTIWKGNLPKIGIRPTIDGRLGRSSRIAGRPNDELGEASRRVDLIGNLRYPNGEPVECVIADTCIGGVAEAAACEDQFRRENVGVSLTVTPCWCYGSETMDMDPLRPKAVFGFNGTERPGAVYLAAVLAGHTQKGIPAFGIYGRDVQEAGDAAMPADVQEKILDFARCGLGRGIDARQGVFVDGRHVDGNRRFDGRLRFLGKVARHACRRHRHERVHRADEQGTV